jgi:hypothetical protein
VNENPSTPGETVRSKIITKKVCYARCDSSKHRNRSHEFASVADKEE